MTWPRTAISPSPRPCFDFAQHERYNAVMRFWVYLLQCADGKYYVGSHRGEDVDARVWEHNEGINPKAFTYSRRPVRLLWCGGFADPAEMVRFERQMKGWSRAKKEAFVRGDWEGLKELSKSRTAPSVKERGRFFKLTHPGEPQEGDST